MHGFFVVVPCSLIIAVVSLVNIVFLVLYSTKLKHMLLTLEKRNKMYFLGSYILGWISITFILMYMIIEFLKS